MESLTHDPNPFADPAALAHSNYCLFDGRRLVRAGGEGTPSKLTAFVHEGFRALALNEHFTCVGAKAAIRQGGYRFGLYDELGSPDACAGLARDLFTFVRERRTLEAEFTTFVASFTGPAALDEARFEALLWSTLQQVHDHDALHHEWDPAVSAEVTDPRFSFSFAATALFVVALHANSSRAARRFAWPTLVFNPHDQFEALRNTGRYASFQRVIRGAEQALQGSVNPMLANFGEHSEARQYSGRHVADAWKCPFHARVRRAEDEP